MIKLDAIASRSVDGSLQTARTMTQVTGVAFMTVENDDSQAVNIRQGFVPFQALVNVVNPLPQPVGIEHRMDRSEERRVGKECRARASPERGTKQERRPLRAQGSCARRRLAGVHS